MLTIFFKTKNYNTVLSFLLKLGSSDVSVSMSCFGNAIMLSSIVDSSFFCKIPLKVWVLVNPLRNTISQFVEIAAFADLNSIPNRVTKLITSYGPEIF